MVTLGRITDMIGGFGDSFGDPKIATPTLTCSPNFLVKGRE
jgi:hypothetical protein